VKRDARSETFQERWLTDIAILKKSRSLLPQQRRRGTLFAGLHKRFFVLHPALRDAIFLRLSKASIRYHFCFRLVPSLRSHLT
jgi:hypothetical protein